MVLEHDYPHAYVRLHICLVKSWQGQPHGLENQALGWLNIKDIDQLGIAGFDPVLPATLPILEKLKTLKVF
jgi:8-oxo-dGTP diphosphatase